MKLLAAVVAVLLLAVACGPSQAEMDVLTVKEIRLVNDDGQLLLHVAPGNERLGGLVEMTFMDKAGNELIVIHAGGPEGYEKGPSVGGIFLQRVSDTGQEFSYSLAVNSKGNFNIMEHTLGIELDKWVDWCLTHRGWQECY